MKKEILYVVAGTLIATSAIGVMTFANSGTTNLPLSNTSPKVAVQDTDKESKDGQINEVNDKKEISSKDKNTKETKDDKVTLPKNAITEAQASQTVLASNPGTKVTGISTEDENGTIVYNIVLDNKSEVKVNVIKGTILKTDKQDGKASEKESSNDSDSKNED